MSLRSSLQSGSDTMAKVASLKAGFTTLARTLVGSLQSIRKPKEEATLQEDDDAVLVQVSPSRVLEGRTVREQLWLGVLSQSANQVHKDNYEVFLLQGPSVEASNDIEKDVTRTFPNTKHFASEEGQSSLRNVLRAYATYDTEVAYCQGMNFIAGLLLMYLTEAESFAAMVVLMEERGLRGVFKKQLGLVQVQLWQLSKLLPRTLVVHLEGLGVTTDMFAWSWLMTCFAADFPVQISIRVMDVLLVFAHFESPLLKVAVGIMEEFEDRLQGYTSFEEALSFLKYELPALPIETLHDMIKHCLEAPWTKAQLAILASSDEAESVAEVQDRVRSALERTDAFGCSTSSAAAVNESSSIPADAVAAPFTSGMAIGFTCPQAQEAASAAGAGQECGAASTSAGGAYAMLLLPPPPCPSNSLQTLLAQSSISRSQPGDAPHVNNVTSGSVHFASRPGSTAGMQHAMGTERPASSSMSAVFASAPISSSGLMRCASAAGSGVPPLPSPQPSGSPAPALLQGGSQAWQIAHASTQDTLQRMRGGAGTQSTGGASRFAPSSWQGPSRDPAPRPESPATSESEHGSLMTRASALTRTVTRSVPGAPPPQRTSSMREHASCQASAGGATCALVGSLSVSLSSLGSQQHTQQRFGSMQAHVSPTAVESAAPGLLGTFSDPLPLQAQAVDQTVASEDDPDGYTHFMQAPEQATPAQPSASELEKAAASEDAACTSSTEPAADLTPEQVERAALMADEVTAPPLSPRAAAAQQERINQLFQTDGARSSLELIAPTAADDREAAEAATVEMQTDERHVPAAISSKHLCLLLSVPDAPEEAPELQASNSVQSVASMAMTVSSGQGSMGGVLPGMASFSAVPDGTWRVPSVSAGGAPRADYDYEMHELEASLASFAAPQHTAPVVQPASQDAEACTSIAGDILRTLTEASKKNAMAGYDPATRLAEGMYCSSPHKEAKSLCRDMSSPAARPAPAGHQHREDDGAAGEDWSGYCSRRTTAAGDEGATTAAPHSPFEPEFPSQNAANSSGLELQGNDSAANAEGGSAAAETETAASDTKDWILSKPTLYVDGIPMFDPKTVMGQEAPQVMFSPMPSLAESMFKNEEQLAVRRSRASSSSGGAPVAGTPKASCNGGDSFDELLASRHAATEGGSAMHPVAAASNGAAAKTVHGFSSPGGSGSGAHPTGLKQSCSVPVERSPSVVLRADSASCSITAYHTICSPPSVTTPPALAAAPSPAAKSKALSVQSSLSSQLAEAVLRASCAANSPAGLANPSSAIIDAFLHGGPVSPLVNIRQPMNVQLAGDHVHVNACIVPRATTLSLPPLPLQPPPPPPGKPPLAPAVRPAALAMQSMFAHANLSASLDAHEHGGMGVAGSEDAARSWALEEAFTPCFPPRTPTSNQQQHYPPSLSAASSAQKPLMHAGSEGGFSACAALLLQPSRVASLELDEHVRHTLAGFDLLASRALHRSMGGDGRSTANTSRRNSGSGMGGGAGDCAETDQDDAEDLCSSRGDSPAEGSAHVRGNGRAAGTVASAIRCSFDSVASGIPSGAACSSASRNCGSSAVHSGVATPDASAAAGANDLPRGMSLQLPAEDS